MKDVALIVFIKNFELGKVKTRLGKSVGNKQALKIYRQLCTFTIEEVKKTGFAAYFYFSDYIDEKFLQERGVNSDSHLYKSRVQKGFDLGIRMHLAFQEVLEDHDRAFILGTDCPYFTYDKILEAIDVLDSDDWDIVIGPAEDGGYYGLGMKRAWDVFSDVDWSTDSVLSQTIDKINDIRLTWEFLSFLNDIDIEKDWVEFRASPSFSYFQEVIRSSSSANETVGE